MKLQSSVIATIVLLCLLIAQGKLSLSAPEPLSSPLPAGLTGKQSNEVLTISAKAVLDKNKAEYITEVNIGNLTENGVDILADCGSLVSYDNKKSVVGSDSFECAAVHSMLLHKKSVETFSLNIPQESYHDGSLSITVRYQTRQGPAEALHLELRSPGPDKG
ncbi:hypothetical protein DFP94_1011160 [Fontibacillus phaseoli]|uniref:Uncharacterized protein n=1 Tax=Fontibacillus phaseoli TaxID=1416533 RepID=A0A369BQ91_9BACL|nr:hypothetical protein [Fontibacillus phaseoli]RCX23561.1 hypothetical protein DFP94_1011160 [Fontibacillus phaseoli]